MDIVIRAFFAFLFVIIVTRVIGDVSSRRWSPST